MVKDPKKSKKGRKKDGDDADNNDQMTAVDRQFYELNIADLNNKLSRLRSHASKLEEKNEELESKMRQMEEDKSDTTAYLNRTLNEKLNIISELEDKLSELSKVRDAENIECKRVLSEREAKYKAMHDQLTSEIKLLTGKLNSMEEFRIQRDELLAKFDAQETELKEQHKRHKAILYDMERKVVLDKDILRKDVENKLLQLSTEFTKSSEIRVAAHTQRLVRENIALNNEMDRMIYTHERLKREHDDMKRSNHRIKSEGEIIQAEKARLVRTCQGQIRIIEELTDAYESLRDRSMQLKNIHKLYEATMKKLKDTERNFEHLQHKIKLLEQHVHAINTQRMALCSDIMLKHKQIDHIFSVLQKVRCNIQSAIRGEEQTPEDEAEFEFRQAQRKTLLDDLLNILTELEMLPIEKPSLESLQSSSYVYLQGDLGMMPKESVETILGPPHKIPSISSSIFMQPDLTPQSSLQIAKMSEPILDVMSGSLIHFDESEEHIPAETIEDEEEEGQQTLPLPRKSIQKESHVDEESVEEPSKENIEKVGTVDEEDVTKIITDADQEEQELTDDMKQESKTEEQAD